MLEYMLTSGLKGALLGGGIGLIGLPMAYLLVRLVDNPARQEVKSNFVVNATFATGFLLFACLTILPYSLAELISPMTQHLFAIAFFTISVASGVGYFDAAKRRIDWFDEGFRLQKWTDTSHFYTWKQIDTIEWDSVLHIWRIHLRNGDTFAFHPMMTGASRFLELAIDKAQLFTEGRYSHINNKN